MKSLKEAVIKAKRLAKKNQTTYFVVWEAGEYEVATEFDLDTWFLGGGLKSPLFFLPCLLLTDCKRV